MVERLGHWNWNLVKPSTSHQLDLLQLVSGSKPQLWLQIANWSAYCQLEFLTCGVYFSCLFIDPKRYERNLRNQELEGANSRVTEIYSRLHSQNFQGSRIKSQVEFCETCVWQLTFEGWGINLIWSSFFCIKAITACVPSPELPNYLFTVFLQMNATSWQIKKNF